MSDFDDEVKEMTGFFVEESEELIEFSVEDILNIEKKSDDQLINRIFRTFHTIKGNSAMLGYENLSVFTHKAEDLLSMMREKKIEVNKQLINGLLKITDVLKEVFEVIKNEYNDDVNMDEGFLVIEELKGNIKGKIPVIIEEVMKIDMSLDNSVMEKKPKDLKKEKLSILVVEDEFVSRAILVDILSEYGACHVAIDGQEAVNAFQLSLGNESILKYDLICMDIIMPNLDGLGAVKKIREIEKEQGIKQIDEVNIIMTTAKRDPKTVMKSLYRSGANAYITKPIDEKMLLIEIRKMLYMEGL